jgi:hypothetical protein
MWGLFWFLNAQESGKEPVAGPMAMSEQERLPPEPRLQAARGFGFKRENGDWVDLEKREPQAEYRLLREQWDQRLNCKSDESHTAAVNCVPIEEAMKKVLDGGGLPVRPANSNSAKPTESGRPTAWSSGRVSDKVGQWQ